MACICSANDPEIKTWFLVRNNWLPLFLTGVYLVTCTFIAPALMKNRKPFKLRNILIVFNFSLVIAYLSFLLYLIWGFFLLKGITLDELCHGFTIKKGNILYNMARACWLIYLVKYVEYLDTIFFILRKKKNQLTFLHVIHHALVPFCTWLCLRTERSAITLVPGLINAIVHVIMYSYYGLSAFGPKMQKYLWWKRYLTQVQMVQFLIIITFMLVVPPLVGCKIVITNYITIVILAALFLFLFYSYYRKNFKLNRASRQLKAEANGCNEALIHKHLNDIRNGITEMNEMFKKEK